MRVQVSEREPCFLPSRAQFIKIVLVSGPAVGKGAHRIWRAVKLGEKQGLDLQDENMCRAEGEFAVGGWKAIQTRTVSCKP